MDRALIIFHLEKCTLSNGMTPSIIVSHKFSPKCHALGPAYGCSQLSQQKKSNWLRQEQDQTPNQHQIFLQYCGFPKAAFHSNTAQDLSCLVFQSQSKVE